jgi:hypothetical protein
MLPLPLPPFDPPPLPPLPLLGPLVADIEEELLDSVLVPLPEEVTLEALMKFAQATWASLRISFASSYGGEVL